MNLFPGTSVFYSKWMCYIQLIYLCARMEGMCNNFAFRVVHQRKLIVTVNHISESVGQIVVCNCAMI